MRFFKLVEINEEEYAEKTRDLEYDYFAQTVTKADGIYPDDKNVYVAIDESEDEIRIDRCDFDSEVEEDE